VANADRIIDLLHEAKSRRAGGERERFLEAACGADADLKEQIVSLLEAGDDESEPDFLKFTRIIRPEFPPTEKPGDRIGRYKLLEQIGEGGCGVVYMAEQEEPVRRRVALKVIKLGMDTKSVIARFEAERQALAMMDHPNIAKVLDAGATDTGRPYFVMELVRGIKITDFCDQHNLSTDDRLKLFAQVCHAIQHAHQKGIIHRDIKPSNILVTISEPGAPGCPRVIDFGIAKATSDQRLTDKTVFTAFEQFIGTPAYMSPEQAMMTSMDIDTRTDIYALGVLLYELLTGRTPFDAKDLMAAGLDAMRRIISEQEPARPSTRLSTMQAADLTTVARQRHAEPGRLSTLLRGDLDWIVMKCLEKDRGRRYETANGLALDIQRHLSSEPVLACPPSAAYRFRKFARRNKLALGAALAGVLAVGLVIVGLAVSNWLVTREKELKEAALHRAVAEKGRADKNLAEARRAVREYLNTAVANTREGVADPHLLRKDLLATAIPFYTEFLRQQQDDPALAAEQGRAYGDLAFLREELGEWEQAREAHEKEVAIFARLASEVPGEPSYRHGLASGHFNQGNVHHKLGQQPKARESYQAALALLEQLVVECPAVPNYRQDLAGTYINLASSLRRVGQLEPALTAFQKASEHQERLAAEHPDQPRTRMVLAIGYMGRATLLSEMGRRDEAVAACRQGAAVFEKLAAEFPRVSEYREGWAGALNNLSVFLCELGLLDEAVPVHRKAITIQEQLTKDFSSLPVHRQDLASSHTNLGVLLAELGNYEEALADHDRALQILQQLARDFPGTPEYHRALALSHTNRGEALRNLDRLEEALSAHRSALTVQEELAAGAEAVPQDRQGLARVQQNLADLLVGLSRYDEALAQLQEALAAREQLVADSPTNALYQIELAGSQGTMGNLLRDRGQPEGALDWYAKSLDRLEQVLTADARLLQARLFACSIYRNRAVALGQLARHEEALGDYNRSIDLDDGQRRTGLSMERAMTLSRLKKHSQALAEVDALVAKPDANEQALYSAACIYAVASTTADADTENYAARAVDLLRRAVENGYKDAAQLQKDKDIDALRSRDDFKKLLGELEGRQD
jgi:tetratricopeptide (TPR) repeat protein/tRNA A-37 threonylcarbamoyl transferase component Bud32